MPFRPIPENLTVVLSHNLDMELQGRNFGYSTYKVTDAVSEASVRRVPDDRVQGAIACEQCGENFDFRVFDTGRTRRFRALWLALGLACPMVFVVVLLLLKDSDAGFAALTIIGSALALLILVIFLMTAWWHEDGTRYRNAKYSDGIIHTMRIEPR